MTQFFALGYCPSRGRRRYARISGKGFYPGAPDEIFILKHNIVAEYGFTCSELVAIPPLPTKNLGTPQRRKARLKFQGRVKINIARIARFVVTL
jgi:hypothetical protein